jgi:hypothetical protein
MRSLRRVARARGGTGSKSVLEYDGGDITQWLKGEEAKSSQMDRVRRACLCVYQPPMAPTLYAAS